MELTGQHSMIAQEAGQFFRQINLHMQGLEEVRGFLQEGRPLEAVHAYRRYLIPRLSRMSEACSPEKLREADLLLENKVALLQGEPEDVGNPVDWLHTSNGDQQWQSHLAYFGYADSLPEAYAATGRMEYLTRWMELIEDFIDHHSYGVSGLEYDFSFPAYVNEYAYKYGGEGRCPGYVGGSWIGLAAHARTEHWLYQLGILIGEEKLPDALVLKILTSLMTDHFFVMLNNARRFTPNQFLGVAVSLLKLGVRLCEFKLAPAAYLIGMDRLEEAFDLCILPDGSDLEQSFNYNTGILRTFLEVQSLFEGLQNERISRLREKLQQRCLFLAACLTPQGFHPNIAKTHMSSAVKENLAEWSKAYGACAAQRILDALDAKNPQAIGSYSFPYGGYFVMRNGIGKKDPYLLFKVSRMGIGHMHEDCGSVFLNAYGANLLIDSGNFNYSDDAVSLVKNRYLTSSRAHNTVTIDGLSQERLSHGGGSHDCVNPDPAECTELLKRLAGLKEKPPMRYVNAAGFDFAEGIYEDGYGEKYLPIKHRRQVFRIGRECFVVVDHVVGAGGRQVQLNWNLDDRFSPDTVCMQDGEIVADDGRSPGIQMISVTKAPLSFDWAYGEEKPFCGWHASEYNQIAPCMHIAASFKAEEQELVVSVLFPFDKGEKKATLKRVQADGNRCFLELASDAFSLEFAAAVSSERLVCKGYTAQAEALAVWENSAGRFGAVLGCEEALLAGKTVFSGNCYVALGETPVVLERF